MEKILVDNYTNLQHGAFLCECLEVATNKSFEEIVLINEVYDHLGEWVTISLDEGDSYEMRNTDYFCSLGILETNSLFAEIINARSGRTETAELPDVFGMLGDMFSHFSVVHPKSITF